MCKHDVMNNQHGHCCLVGPGCSLAATSSSLCANMTSSTKPVIRSITTSSEEDRATDAQKIGEDRTRGSEDMIVHRQTNTHTHTHTHRQTDGHAHHNTPLPYRGRSNNNHCGCDWDVKQHTGADRVVGDNDSSLVWPDLGRSTRASCGWCAMHL